MLHTVKKQNAFTLLELSIVLVIIGLIVGGITVGSSMIRAAELRSVLSDINEYKAVIYTFRDKYFAIPGDMPNAIEFWGAAHTTPATCLVTPSTGTETCDGDGDGMVESANLEKFRAWQHLANAGLVDGQFAGVSGNYIGGATGVYIGGNVPESSIGGAGYDYQTVADKTSTNAFYFEGSYGLSIEFGRLASGGALTESLLTPAEAWGLDKKIDDGLPGLGTVRARKYGFRPNCSDNDDPQVSEYQLDSDVIGCNLLFIID